MTPSTAAPAATRRGAASAIATRPAPPRAVIAQVRPTVPDGLPAKATLGLPLTVSALIVADGHDLLCAWVRHGRPGRTAGNGRRGAVEVPMAPLGNDRWAASFTPAAVGPAMFEVVALPDDYGTWLRDLRRRLEAGQDVEAEWAEGARLVEERLARSDITAPDRRALGTLLASLHGRRPRAARGNGAAANDVAGRLLEASQPTTVALMQRTADRARATVAGPLPLWVDRELGGFSAWYEMFPRSEGAAEGRSGSFATAARRLRAIAGMGFDIVYLPPIHPIGRSYRKGRNNSLEAGPDDVGSPWAIGAEEGGHTAVHPDLGTLDDFDDFVAEARRCGLEVALDYALQCSPDHPWVRQHPQWFRHRADGSIRYAENPPKKYQDIYPFDFDTEDWEALWAALRDVVLFWIGHGVRVVRVDNPHTKPLPFWRWLIDEVHREHPDVIFLSEAFTRPAVMHRLAQEGFTQSYTYFTWRNTKQELSEYLTELSQTEQVDWMRPNFWVNTPDILHEVLQAGGPPAFRLRAVLAALCCPSWGMYSGYELCERTPVRAGSEEYLDSEKYQLRPRDWNAPDSLAPFITRLNAIRRRHHAAVAQLRTLRLHHVDGDAIMAISRMDDARDDLLLVVVNLDPTSVQSSVTWLDMEQLVIPWDATYEAHDELTDTTYMWQGPRNFVRLDPAAQPAHVLHLRTRGA